MEKEFNLQDHKTKALIIADVVKSLPNDEQVKAWVDVNAGYMEVQNQDKQISISISRYNELINSKWNLKDIYSKNGMITSLWRNKETGEKKEGIGTYPPSEPLNLNAP